MSPQYTALLIKDSFYAKVAYTCTLRGGSASTDDSLGPLAYMSDDDGAGASASSSSKILLILRHTFNRFLSVVASLKSSDIVAARRRRRGLRI